MSTGAQAMGRPRWLRAHVGRLIAVTALVFTLPGCPGEGDFEGARVVNESGSDVQVFRVRDDREVLVESIPEGVTATLISGQLGGDPCSRVPLVARTLDGSVVERRPPPLCNGEEWIIDGEPTDRDTQSP
jgi:hypothetical protein